jgi:hypothetical protein
MNTNNAFCVECSAQYNQQHDDEFCEDCRFVKCAGCDDLVHRNDVCEHGIDGFNNCDCECRECLRKEEDERGLCLLLILYSICIRL